MATKLSERIKERKKKLKEEGQAGSSSTSSEKKELSLRERIKKREMEQQIGFDTLNDDLKATSTVINNIYGNWQTNRTMSNYKSTVSDMYSRLNAYQKYLSLYGDGKTDISDLVSGYKSVLGDWDTLKETYGRYEDADSYKTETTKLNELYNMSLEDLESRLSEKNPIAYTTYGGEEISWKSLYDNKKHSQMATSNEGKLGWNQYLIDEEAKRAEANAKEEDEWQWLWDAIGAIGSSGDTTLPTSNVTQVVNDKRKDDSYAHPTDEWSETEQKIFGAYYYEDPEKAYEYATSLNNAKALAKKNEAKQDITDSATSGFWAGAGHTAGSIVTAPLGLADYLDDLTDAVAGRPIIEESTVSPFEYSQTVQGGISNKLNESGTLPEWIPIIGGKGLGDAYGLGTSIIQSAVSAPTLGVAGTFVSYFGQASASAVDDALSRGATDDQALLYGLALGIAEGIPEAVSAKFLNGLGTTTKNGLLSIIMSQGGEEAVEEGLTSVLGQMADNVILQDKSAFNSLVRQYMADGMSESEATQKAWGETFEGVLYDTLAGGLSGATHAGVQAPVNMHMQNSAIGSTIRENQNTNALKDLATETGNGAYQKYIDLINSDNISDAKLGKFYGEVQNEIETDYNRQRADSIMHSVANRANELGDSKNSGLIASAIQKTIDGQKLSSAEKTALKSDTAQVIIDEMKRGEFSFKESASLKTATKYAQRTSDILKTRTMVKTTGEDINIEGIKEVDGKQVIVTDKGEFSADDVTLSQNDADLLHYAQGMSKEKASLFIENYDGKSNVEEYKLSFDLAYMYGKDGIDVNLALEHKGVLSDESAYNIYSNPFKKQMTAKTNALAKINEKHQNKDFKAGKVNDSVIDYNNDGKGKINWDDLNDSEKKQIAIGKGFANVFGVNVEFFVSEADKDGNFKGANGSFDPSTNTVYLDVHAGRKNTSDADSYIIQTMSHEITHWAEKKSPELFAKLSNIAIKTLSEAKGISAQRLVAIEKGRLQDEQKKRGEKVTEISDEMAVSELVARACEQMLGDSAKAKEMLEGLSNKEQKSLIKKIKETIKNFLSWVNDVLSTLKPMSDEAQFMKAQKEAYEKSLKVWEEMIVDAVNTNQSLEAEGILADELINGISDDGTTIVGNNNIQMSERTYAEGGRDFLVKWLDEQKGITDEDKQDIIAQTDKIAELMKDIRENNELPDYARWATLDVVKDENGEKILSVIVKNGDYAMNIDFSQVCKKRVALNAVLNALVQSGDLNAYTLTETDIADLNAIIKKHEFEIACALCFVDSKRYRIGSWAESFCEGADKKKNGKMVHQYGFNEMVRSLVPKGSNLQIEEFNFTNRNIVGQPTENLLSEYEGELDFTLIDEIMEREYKPNGKSTDLYSYAKAIKENKEFRKILNPAEIISSIGLDNIRLESPELYRLINRHQGTARPKFAHEAVAYVNDILKANIFTKEKAKMVGGVRAQSFSDFMANMVFDYVQFISELSAKELTAHSYTKEPLFVKLFGMTGMKINMSLVPKAVEMTPEQQKYFAILNDKNANKRSPEYKKAQADYKKLTENAGLDENGNYIWEDETFPYEVAMEIVDDPRYSKNCGTIAVGISDNHILKLLNDDRISMVIPYHKSGLNHIVAKMRNIDLYNDYTKTQNTRLANGSKLQGVANFDFYGDLYGVDGKEGTNDPKKTAENYLKWCDEHNYIPKFEKSVNSRIFRDNPNYYKLLIDFRVYDTDGTYAEQQAVKPIYPSTEEFKDLILNGVVHNGVTYGGLKQAQGTASKLDAESKQIVDEYRELLKNKYGKDVLGKQYSSSREVAPLTEEDYKNATKHFGTTGNFNVAGYMLKDGKMLDFSGKHWGDTTSRSRQVDHRDIQEVIPDNNNGFDSMVNMISNGNIRLMPEDGGINLAVDPTKNQRTVLRRYIEFFKGECVVDIDAVGGDTVQSFTYDKGTSADRILKDIDNYFKGGRQSDLMRFHTMYSDREIIGASGKNYGKGVYLDSNKLDGLTDEERKAKVREIVVKEYAGKELIAYNNKKPVRLRIAKRNEKILNPNGRKQKVIKELYAKNNDLSVKQDAILLVDELVANAKYKASMPSTQSHGWLDNYGKNEWDYWTVYIQEKNGSVWEATLDIANTVDGEKILYDIDPIKMVEGVIEFTPASTKDSVNDVANKSQAQNSDRESWLDATSIDDIFADLSIEDLIDDEMFLDEDFSDELSVEDAPKKVRAKRRVDAVNKRLKEIGLSFNGTKSLAWTDERIDDYLDYYASSNPNYAQAYITYMTPQQFLNLTVGDKNVTLDVLELESEAYGDLNFEKLGKDKPIRLSIKEGRVWSQVTSHEGRHRMILLGKAGFEKVPVLVIDRSTDYGKTAKDELKLIPEKWISTEYISKSRNTVVKDVIPFSQGNRDLIIEKFGSGTEADIHYSSRDTMTRAEANALADKKVESYKRKMEKKARVESIKDKVLTLNEWMRKNSKEKHVPEAMKPIVAHLIKAIDFSSERYLGMTGGKRKGEPTQNDISLARALSDVYQMVSEAKVDEAIIYELYGDDLSAELKDLVKSANLYARTVGDNEFIINRMTAEELQRLDRMVWAIKMAVTQMNKFHVANASKGIAYTAQQDILHMKSMGQIKLHKGKFAKNLSQMLNWGNATPYTAFKRFGEGGIKIFEALMDGWDKFVFNINTVIEYANNTYTEKEVREWGEKVHEFDILLPATKEQLADPNFKGNRQKISMTTAQIMSLYCLQKREQAKGHILGGGIRITDIETKNGVVSQSDGVVIAEKELNRIISILSTREKQVADALQKFMNEECTVWGNEISMKRFGYKAFGEQNYFPIKSDSNVTGDDNVKEVEKTLYRLLNMSFTKSLTEKANNRIVVDNIFDVFAQHTSEMAKYNAMALPVLDATRWFNYKERGNKVDTHFETRTLRGAMEKAYGTDAINYVRTFLQDINGAENVARDSLSKGFLSKAKIASVGFNAKVVALQPTSYLRASAVIDNKYLAQAFTKMPKTKLAQKWCGMAKWKSLGFIDINVQRGVVDLIKHDKTLADEVTEASMKWAGKADEVTLGYLWNACEFEVRDKYPALKVGSDEYYTKVGKRLREIIYATQVVDSTMTRSHMMRSGDRFDKILTNFASEPTVSYNMLMDAYYDFKMTERQTGSTKNAFNKHGKKLARTMYAYTITSVITALLESEFEVFRDDEEKDEEEILTIYLENLWSNMSVLNKIPYLKEGISILQGFTSSRLDTQWMQYFAYTIKGVGKLLAGEGNAYKTTKNGFKFVSYLSGIPFYNAGRDPLALLEKLGLVSLEELEEWFNETIGEIFPSLKSK